MKTNMLPTAAQSTWIGGKVYIQVALALAGCLAWGLLLQPLLGKQWITSVTGLMLVVLLTVCAVTDLARHQIPNWATYTVALLALVINTFISLLMWKFDLTETAVLPEHQLEIIRSLGVIGLGPSLCGFSVTFAVMLCIYLGLGCGAGDVKLAAAIGALTGVACGLEAIIWTHILAGIYVIARLIWEIGLLTTLSLLVRRMGSFLLPTRIAKPTFDSAGLLNKPIPLAAFFAAGTLLALSGVTWQ